MQHVNVTARGGRRWVIVVIVAAATLISCCVDLSSAGAQDSPPSTPNYGRIWYEKYWTPCHGAGGAPGSAVFIESKQPIDLRTYVPRHGGEFPAGDWLMVVFGRPPQNPHTEIRERIQRDQSGGTASDVETRAKVRSIADYLLSIQAK